MTKKKKTCRLAKELLATAKGMNKAGILDDVAYDKITLRHLSAKGRPKVAPISPNQIRGMWERAKMSQAVFACYLNLTVGYISQLERGTKRPTGAALALLNVIRRKGSTPSCNRLMNLPEPYRKILR
jgi:putative transcriptional regulator